MSNLDQYFKEQIDSDDAFMINFDENAFLDDIIERKDALDVLASDMESDEPLDDDSLYLARMSDEDLDELINDDEIY